MYRLFDEDQTIQNYIKQTEANNEESLNKTVKEIIDYMSSTINDDIAKVSTSSGKLLKALTDDYLSEDFVRKYVDGSVQNQ